MAKQCVMSSFIRENNSLELTNVLLEFLMTCFKYFFCFKRPPFCNDDGDLASGVETFPPRFSRIFLGAQFKCGGKIKTAFVFREEFKVGL